MEHQPTPSPDPASTDAASPFNPPAPLEAPEPPRKRIGWLQGHLPDSVDPLLPIEPDTSFTQTRRLRHDGWTPDKMRAFLERFAECGVITEACEAAGMSARSAYNLRDRDPLFAAGWDAATVKASPRLADEVFSRSMNGVVERIYKDGIVVAERHRYDNRLTMAALTRLDARLDRARERGDTHLNVAVRWDDYLAALGADRREDSMALLAPPEPEPAEPAAPAPAAGPNEDAGYRELHGLHLGEEPKMEADGHDVWEAEGRLWTNYPPPADFDGEEEGSYGDYQYSRTLSAAEQAVIDGDLAEDRARAEAKRDAYFGFDAPAADAADDPKPGDGDGAHRMRAIAADPAKRAAWELLNGPRDWEGDET